MRLSSYSKRFTRIAPYYDLIRNTIILKCKQLNTEQNIEWISTWKTTFKTERDKYWLLLCIVVFLSLTNSSFNLLKFVTWNFSITSLIEFFLLFNKADIRSLMRNDKVPNRDLSTKSTGNWYVIYNIVIYLFIHPTFMFVHSGEYQRLPLAKYESSKFQMQNIHHWAPPLEARNTDVVER